MTQFVRERPKTNVQKTAVPFRSAASTLLSRSIMFRNIAVGISGGVDSAVAAHLLKQKGYNVIGVFMKNWDELDELGRCSGSHDLSDATYACNKLGIALKQVNYVKDYWNSVFVSFLEDYQCGLTPNPDILCNKHIKFDILHKYALNNLKCDAFATGHYARNSLGNFLEKFDVQEKAHLLLPRDSFKDQTFFLSGISRESLRSTMFPLGDHLKAEVKKLAECCGLTRLLRKKESTGLCFVGNRDFKQFIREYIKPKPGVFIDVDTGQVVGQHDGIHQWTIGQRCRLPSCRQPYFVAFKNVLKRVIYVAAGHDHPSLFTNHIYTEVPNWLCPDPLANDAAGKLTCRFRFQHTKPLVPCTLQRRTDKAGQGDELLVTLEQPLRAITPGQFAVFYTDFACLGSARIQYSVNQEQQRETLDSSAIRFELNVYQQKN